MKMKKALIAGAALAALTLTAVTGAQAQGIYFGVGASPYYDRDDYGYYHHPYYDHDWYWRHHYYRHYYRDYDDDDF